MRVGTNLVIVLLASVTAGCSRGHYRRAADADSYTIIQEKTAGSSWSPPENLTIERDPRSRFSGGADLDHPTLPDPTPQLHAYELPGKAQSGSTLRLEEQPKRASPDYEGDLPVRPIQKSAWQAVPTECLARMLEFDSVREEYHRTFGSDPPAELRDPAPRLALQDIVEIALINSREYQTQKESLYKAALALSLQRFAYDLKFSGTGNGTQVEYDHTRAAGNTINTLSVPSGLHADKLLATGGTFLATFANEVVLTFNGPNGFATDIGSKLMFDLTQPIFQRDIRFQPLIQAERDVIYAARDFARFRERLFFDLASDYYTLLRRYRQIEIESQNYFSLVQALNQAEAEERAGIQSRIQVEQIEQQMLLGRSRLSTTCNGLETNLDLLKIAMGLPTEQAMNLDLAVLQQLTLQDEVQVAGERVSRARRRLQIQLEKDRPDRADLLNSGIVLNKRALEWLRLRERFGEAILNMHQREEQLARMRVDEARLNVDTSRAELTKARDELKKARQAVPSSLPTLVLQRTLDAAEAMQRLVGRQLELAGILHADPKVAFSIDEQNKRLQDEAKDLHKRVNETIGTAQLEQLDELLREAEHLHAEVEKAVPEIDKLIATPAQRLGLEEEMQRAMQQVHQLLAEADQMLQSYQVGLVAMEIGMDDAMLTALFGRLDLMNLRGKLADHWRVIKYAADELKSVMNLNAQQSIFTRENRPFGFTLDNSQTKLGLTFDLPLNRKAKRNLYREALIDYQASLRGLTLLEDNIKFAVRDELRGLALARTQYLISVASGALAAERVDSTRLQLALGIEGVAARDFLEAQDAYRTALSAVADNHIRQIVDRTRFFFDMELMELDQSGSWPEIQNERLQPVPLRQFPPNSGPAYGELPEFLRLSRELEQNR